MLLRAATPGPLALEPIDGDCGTHKRYQGRFIDLATFGKVDGAPYVALQARIEEAGGIRYRGSLREGELDRLIVGLPGADDSAARPDGSVPLPFLRDRRIGSGDHPSKPREEVASPIREIADPRIDQLRRRLA